MKKILMVALMLIGGNALYAQMSANHGKWEENSNDNVKIRQDNQYANTELAFDRKRITFSDLPDVKRGTMAILTNPAGEVLSQKKVDPVNNSMDIHWLQRGELYYVTLVYKNKTQKGFVVHY